MRLTAKRKLALALSALVLVAVAGGAYAATQSSPDPRQAFLNDAAKRLNVTPQKLRSALQGALIDRLNAAVAAGRLSKAEAKALEQRIAHGFAPGAFGGRFAPGLRFGGRFPPGFGFGGRFAPGFAFAIVGPGPGRLEAAANYLGLTRRQLLEQLMSGKSLAQVAQARHRSRAGLEAAMLAAVRAKLDKAVRAKALTSAQEQQILAQLPKRLDAEISGKPPIGPGGLHTFRLFRGPRGFERHYGFMPGPPPGPGQPPMPLPGAAHVPPPAPSPVY